MNRHPRKIEQKKGFTLIEVLIAVGLVLFAAASIIEIFGNGVKNIERLSNRYESRYLHTFILDDDAILPGSSGSDFYKYISSKYSIDNNRVYEYLNGINYEKKEIETSAYLKDTLNNDLLKGYLNEVDINGTTIGVMRLKELLN
jgi:prepilin-type N-terminal cleavage/methylation domain-containing protein